MNFLMRSTASVSADRSSIHSVRESQTDSQNRSSSGSTLESLISEDPYTRYSRTEEYDGETDGVEGKNGSMTSSNTKSDLPSVAKHLDVSEDEGWITIPYKELPENWNHAPDILSLRSLDRSFLFPGEQVQILACLSACKQDTEIITPFKVAAVMSKNDIDHSPGKGNGEVDNGNNFVFGEGELSASGQEQKGEKLSDVKLDRLTGVTTGESLLRMEVHKRKTALLLQKFKNSHFFVRITDSDEPLWSKRGASEKFSNSSGTNNENCSTIGTKETAKYMSPINAVIDKGIFDATISGGVARNSVKCCTLPNGDIVVLLQVHVGVNYLRDPCIEVLQFEKYEEKILSFESQDGSVGSVYIDQDPCRELLKWLIPLDNTLPPPARPLSPPHLSSNSGIGSTAQRSNFSASSGSQLFSFGHFRSYSMSSLPQNINPPTAPVKVASSKPNFDHEDWDQISSQNILRKKPGAEELLSFRGVSLERERFSVCCGLEGIYTPGRRWRRKLEIIQPIEIHSFANDCNSEDLLCVLIKNVAPANAANIVIYIDAITIIFEEATKSGPPSSLPIACIEAGNDHSLPNLALRRGEEHSFILKPATSVWKNLKVQGERSPQTSKLSLSSKSLDGRKIESIDNQYAIIVSCRCNYTASRLFFKHPTSWRPRSTRDIMISVASEMSGKSSGPNETSSHLPVQVLTLQASNLTSEDLTLTVLAPASFTSLPSVVSLNSPCTPMSPFIGFAECLQKVNGDRRVGATRGQSFTSHRENKKQNDDGGPQTVSISDDVIPSSGLSCTHLWLQSRVPLGCIPSQSTATIKLELLPLTDGIITLDTLQIHVKEKGVAYIPECSLKINATSGISTGIF